MKRQDLLTILITFAMGIVLGFYIYVTGFATNNQRESMSPDEEESGLIITGEAYGGCQRVGNCPSFNIAADGTYRYFYTPLGSSEQIMKQGVMPFAMQQQLQQHVLQPALTAQRLPIQPVFCESFVDGIDVRYRVTLDGVESVLNSCGTDVVADSGLWQALSNIWTYFERNS